MKPTWIGSLVVAFGVLCSPSIFAAGDQHERPVLRVESEELFLSKVAGITEREFIDQVSAMLSFDDQPKLVKQLAYLDGGGFTAHAEALTSTSADGTAPSVLPSPAPREESGASTRPITRATVEEVLRHYYHDRATDRLSRRVAAHVVDAMGVEKIHYDQEEFEKTLAYWLEYERYDNEVWKKMSETPSAEEAIRIWEPWWRRTEGKETAPPQIAEEVRAAHVLGLHRLCYYLDHCFMPETQERMARDQTKIGNWTYEIRYKQIAKTAPDYFETWIKQKLDYVILVVRLEDERTEPAMDRLIRQSVSKSGEVATGAFRRLNDCREFLGRKTGWMQSIMSKDVMRKRLNYEGDINGVQALSIAAADRVALAKKIDATIIPSDGSPWVLRAWVLSPVPGSADLYRTPSFSDPVDSDFGEYLYQRWYQKTVAPWVAKNVEILDPAYCDVLPRVYRELGAGPLTIVNLPRGIFTGENATKLIRPID